MRPRPPSSPSHDGLAAMSHDPTAVSESHRARRRWFSGLLGAILLVFAVQNLGAMRATTATSDETSHLPAGYTYVATGDYRLNPQHPPLVKILAGLPLLALEPRLNLADPGWNASPPEEWGFGFRFLYANDADRLLFWGRLPVVAGGTGLYLRALLVGLFLVYNTMTFSVVQRRELFATLRTLGVTRAEVFRAITAEALWCDRLDQGVL